MDWDSGQDGRVGQHRKNRKLIRNMGDDLGVWEVYRMILAYRPEHRSLGLEEWVSSLMKQNFPCQRTALCTPVRRCEGALWQLHMGHFGVLRAPVSHPLS